MRTVFAALTLCMATTASADCVVMLHGLARSSASFLVMETGLEGIGYDVVNVDYPSTDGTIEELANEIIPNALAQCPEKSEIHFVTHSMGGILVRYYLEHTPIRPANLRHVVMLGPPNKGSPVVDRLSSVPGFEFWNGIAGRQLGVTEDSVPNQLGPVDYSVGVIAGNQSVSPIFSGLIDGDDDGKVAVASTRVDGMSDHIILPVTHTFMQNNPAVFKQVAHYLREGHFKHNVMPNQ